MNVRSLVVAALIASPVAVALPMQAAHAQASFDLRIGTPPPPPRVVVVPAPRRGYVWAPGYWRWNGRRHVWMDGHWVRERRGYHYAEPRWEQDRGDYGFRRGGWRRD
jgi:WXXGXW repeat (2 copies)